MSKDKGERVFAVEVEIVRDMDVPRGAWDWIEAIAAQADGPHRRIETPNDAETIVFWHNERPAAVVLNLRDQFNHSVQLRLRIAKTEPPAAEGEVTQADRDFVADFRRALLADKGLIEQFIDMSPFEFRNGSKDDHWFVKRAAKHRLASRTTETEAATALREAARKAHDTLIELNPNNYSHKDVCEANDAAVEAILLLADVLGETHGKTADWWAKRRAALTPEKANG